MGRDKLGMIVTLVSAASFGAMSIFAKFAYDGGANVPTVLFLRFALAACFFWGYILFYKKDYKPYPFAVASKLFLLGALGYGSMSACFFLAVSRLPASLAGMLLYLYPALVTITTIVLKQETYTRQKGLALLITSLGLLLVLGTSFEGIDFLGILFGLGAACTYTVYIVTGSKVLQRLEPLKATAYIIAGAAGTYLFFGLLTGNLSFNFTGLVWWAVGGIVLISTIVAILFFWLGVQLIGAARASIISTIEPLVTVVLAWLAFEEMLSPVQLAGGALIILGVFVLQHRGEKEKTAELQKKLAENQGWK